MSQTKVEITGDARHLEREYKRLERRQDEQDEGHRTNARTAQQSSRQQAAAHEASAGKGAASYNRILRELKKQGPEGRAQAKAIEKHLQATGKAGRRSMHEIIDEIDKIDDHAAAVARNARHDFQRAGNAGEKAFGGSAVASLGRLSMGWVGVGTAISAATLLVNNFKQAQEDAVTSMESLKDGNALLLQVSTDSDDFRDMQDTADRLSGTYGIQRDEARRLGFAARSNGFEESQDFIASNSQFLSIDQQSIVAGKVPNLFPNEDLRPEETINATIVAAAESDADFSKIASVLPTVAASAAPTGSTFDESAAMLSVLAGKLKSADAAADRIAAFAAEIDRDTKDTDGRRALADRGVMEAVKIMVSEFTDEQRANFLGGSKELNEAFNLLSANIKEVAGRQDVIREGRLATGTAESASAERRRMARGDSRSLAIQQNAAARNRLEIAKEQDLGVTATRREAAASDEEAGYREEGRHNSATIVRGIRALEFGAVDLYASVANMVGRTDLSTMEGDLAAIRENASAFSPEELQRADALDYAVGRLIDRQQSGERVELSSEEVQRYLNTIQSDDAEITDSEITPEVVRSVNRKLLDAVEATPANAGVNNFLGFLPHVDNLPRQKNLLNFAKFPDQLMQSIEKGLSELRDATNRTNELLEKNQAAAEETAANTRPQPTDPAGRQRTESAIADSRGDLQ